MSQTKEDNSATIRHDFLIELLSLKCMPTKTVQ